MQLKKILVSILVAIMMFSLVALVATANDEVAPTKPSINLVAELGSVTKVGDKNVISAGDTFEYILKIENNPGIGAFKFSVLYNAASVQIEKYELGKLFTPSLEGAESEDFPEMFDVDKNTAGKITLSGNKLGFAETKENGTLITITFKVKDGFHGEIDDILVDEANQFGFMGSIDAGLLTVKANVTNASEIKVHSYEEKVTPPTCTEPGQITYKCKNCDDQMVLEDTNNPATGHKEPAEFTVVTPATCTTTGLKEKVCVNGCGTVLATEEIPVVPHNLPDTWTETVAPTIEAVGKEERKCADCDYKETRDIAKLPPLPKFTSAPNSPWTIGSDEAGLEFVTDAAFADFKSVSINGTELIASNYTVTEGSTKVLLKAEYLDTLAEGEYKITVTSANGSAETTFSVVEETSIAPIIICIVVIVVVGGVVATIVVLKKKELI